MMRGKAAAGRPVSGKGPRDEQDTTLSLRVALIGCGLIGRRRADVIRRTGDGTLVVAADVDLARAEAVAEDAGCQATADWEAVVHRDDVQAVIVATPHNALAAITTAALRRGKHVLVEKPMARTPTEADAVLKEAAPAGGRDGRDTGDRPLVVKVGFNHRHHPAIWKAHEMCAQGKIGEPSYIRCRYGHGGRPGYAQEWRFNREVAGGGELLDQGIHAIDLCRWFLGDVVEGFGYTPSYFWAPEGSGGARGDHPSGALPVEDNAFGLLRTAAGKVASLHVSWTQWKNTFSFEVFGHDGYVIVEGLGGSYGPERLTWGRRRPESGPPQERSFEFPGPDLSWDEEWKEFTAAIREGRQPLGNAEDARQAVRVVHAIYESGRTGRAVRLGADGA